MISVLGVKNAVFVPLGVFSIKRFTGQAFVVPFRILSQKKLTGANVFCKSWYILCPQTRILVLLRESFQNI